LAQRFVGVVASMLDVLHAFGSSRTDMSNFMGHSLVCGTPFVVSALANDFSCKWAGPNGPAH
jgi:hypothetical protein